MQNPGTESTGHSVVSYPFVTLPGMAAHPDPIRFPAGEASRVGYARVSTAGQSLDSQIDSLRDAGCGIVFTDRAVSGATTSRPGLDAALAHRDPTARSRRSPAESESFLTLDCLLTTH